MSVKYITHISNSITTNATGIGRNFRNDAAISGGNLVLFVAVFTSGSGSPPRSSARANLHESPERDGDMDLLLCPDSLGAAGISAPSAALAELPNGRGGLPRHDRAPRIRDLKVEEYIGVNAEYPYFATMSVSSTPNAGEVGVGFNIMVPYGSWRPLAGDGTDESGRVPTRPRF